MAYLDTWTIRVFTNPVQHIKNILDEVAQINLYKTRSGRSYFRKNDYNFEQVIATYLANRFIQMLPNNCELGLAEKLTRTNLRSDKQPDFTLVNNGRVEEIMEVKAISSNQFSCLTGDVSKLRGLNQVQNKFLLSINLYDSQKSYTQRGNRCNTFIQKVNLRLVSNSLLHRASVRNGGFQVVFHYFLFEV